MNYVLIGLAAVIILWFIFTYNGLVSLRLKVKNSFSQIDVHLKKRYDLIPNLVETVKGYASHEKEVFEEVTKARSRIDSAGTIDQKAEAEGGLTKALNHLFAVAENYPELKANTNFLELQGELSRLEEKIAFARQFYNDTVMMYNRKIAYFPSNLVANLFHFTEEPFFTVESEEEREAPKVKF
ncbi:MAG: LemA family protein [Bacillota bacterium]|nr:LemA family protein [Bacillota bacterium]